ncbi:MAG: hypothetical protein CMO01_17850 [Thalassobius sp.]|nr:hypothetical protein [Thalassovita sp.]
MLNFIIAHITLAQTCTVSCSGGSPCTIGLASITCDETGSAPASGDEIIITDGVTIEVSGNNTLDANLRIQDGGHLDFPGSSDKIDLNDGTNSGCGRYIIIESGGLVTGSSGSNQLRICGTIIAKGGGACNAADPPTEADAPVYCLNGDGLGGEVAIDENGVNSGLLPVELVFFKGQLKGGIAELKWRTSSETNFNYFKVLHSADGSAFSEIGKVYGKGDEESLSDYIFEHHKIVPGNNYYMLEIIDKDSSTTYSAIISISNFNESQVEVFPSFNQSQGDISIIMPAYNYRYVKVTYTDIRGVKAYSTLIKNYDGNYLKISPNKKLSPALYFIEVNTDRFTYRQKLEVVE